MIEKGFECKIIGQALLLYQIINTLEVLYLSFTSHEKKGKRFQSIIEQNRFTFCNFKNNFAELESWVPAPVWLSTMLGPVWELTCSPWLQWEPEPSEVFLSRSLFHPFPWSAWKWIQTALLQHGCPGHSMAPANSKWKANKETRKAENNAHWLRGRFILLISRPLGQNNISKYHVQKQAQVSDTGFFCSEGEPVLSATISVWLFVTQFKHCMERCLWKLYNESLLSSALCTPAKLRVLLMATANSDNLHLMYDPAVCPVMQHWFPRESNTE